MRRYGESKAHEKAKEQVANALRNKGFTVYIDSYPFECHTQKGPRTYWPDVYGQNYCSLDRNRADSGRCNEQDAPIQSGCRRIIVEIQGPKGHNTKLASSLDSGRLTDIRENHGSDIEYYEVFLKSKKSPNDIRNWSQADIEEELGL